jgi:3-deoxy-D-manno-octulosonic-acid transferase
LSAAPPRNLALALYGALGHLLTPLVRWHLVARRRRGREHPTRWPERFGTPGAPRPPGPLVWLHGASVGEALSAEPLIAWLRIHHPDATLLLTTGTVTSAAVAAERFGDAVRHQFVPIDLPAAARRFLDHWRPDVALWLESELWPTLLRATAARGVPIVLINGRLSAGSHRRWRRVRPVARAILATFRLMLAQSETDAARLRDLAGTPVACPGNLKRAGPPLPHDDTLLAALRARVGRRPLWLAASTHPGEETIILRTHAYLAARRRPDLLTVIVPRHPARGPEIRDMIAANGFPAGLRSAGDQLGVRADVYVADTLGELGLWYRLADVAFVGGTLVPHGGQNPLEGARLGCAQLYGPGMSNFTEFAGGLVAAGAAETVADDNELMIALEDLLDDPARRRAMGAAGTRYAAGGDDVVARVADALAPILAGLPKA